MTPLPRPVVAVWSAMALVLLALMAWDRARSALQTLDDAVWEWVVSIEEPALVSVSEALDVFGGTVVMNLLAVVGFGAMWARRQRWQATAWLAAIVVPQVLNVGLKNVYQRQRPPMPLISESTWSFPSGHSVLAAAVVAAIIYTYLSSPEARGRWLIGGSIYVAAMAFSRVYLRVHWLSDVVTGVAVGVAVATLVILIVELIAQRSTTSQEP